MTTIHLLYVDDEENWLNAVGQILQTGEFVVDTATDGEMALQKMAEQRYDMILLDVRLKEENGWESVRRFKQVQREVAVVLFTSDYEVERLTDVFGVGVEDYLEKSSDIGILSFCEKSGTTGVLPDCFRSIFSCECRNLGCKGERTLSEIE